MPVEGGRRFTVVVDGVGLDELTRVWSDLCQAGQRPPAPEFRAVYPFVTTVQGNRFRFRGGDPRAISENLQKLLMARLKQGAVRVRIEN